MSELLIPDKYEVLFKIPEAKLVLSGKSNAISNIEAEKLSKIDIVIVTGGRNSGKSYTVSLADAYWTEHYNYRTLFTRYTLVSAEDTIIADFMEKIDLLGFRKFFRMRKDRVSHKVKNAKVVFKGIKTSAGNQTANLKSLKNFNIFLLDEGEEMDSYADWHKIYLSMRCQDVQNMSIISMNPTDKEFWVYKEFFEKRGVEGTVPKHWAAGTMVSQNAYGADFALVMKALNGVLDVTDRKLVSTDFNHDPASAIFASDQTSVQKGNLARVLVWYDNEWAFSNRMLDTAGVMARFL